MGHKKRSSHILFFSPTGSVEMAAESSTKKFGKGERTVPHHSEKASKYYPAIDEAVPRKTRKAVRPQAPTVVKTRHRPHLARRSIPWQACHPPQGPWSRCPPCHRPIQDQRCPTPTSQCPLCHRHQHLR